MGGWNNTYAKEGGLKGASGKYEARLEIATNETPAPVGMPELGTGLTGGKEIGEARFRKLFESGTGEIMITADDIFADPGKYFVINLERKDKGT
jgi:hypothetical protein